MNNPAASCDVSNGRRIYFRSKLRGINQLHKIKVSEKHDYRLVLMMRNNKVWAENISLAKKIFYKK